MLMLSLMGRRGPSSIEIEDAGLVIVSGPDTASTGKITDMGNGEFLVTVDKVPTEPFVVLLRGKDKLSKTDFQRQSTTQMSVSKVNIQVGTLFYSMH